VLAASPRCASEALRIIAALTLTPSSASPASERHQHPARSRPSAPSPPSVHHSDLSHISAAAALVDHSLWRRGAQSGCCTYSSLRNLTRLAATPASHRIQA
jgi:hypothetical protein